MPKSQTVQILYWNTFFHLLTQILVSKTALTFFDCLILFLVAREMERVSGFLARTPLKHQSMDPAHLPVSSAPRCARLLLFFSRNPHSLQDTWCLLFQQSPYANPWFPIGIEFYSTRMSYVRLLLRINFVDFFMEQSDFVSISGFRGSSISYGSLFRCVYSAFYILQYQLEQTMVAILQFWWSSPRLYWDFGLAVEI